MKPICVPCQRFFRPRRNGYPFMEMMPAADVLPPAGLAAPDQWKPYKIWQGDLWGCDGCGTEIIVGVARAPHAEHYQPDFAETAKLTGADQLQINDC